MDTREHNGGVVPGRAGAAGAGYPGSERRIGRKVFLGALGIGVLGVASGDMFSGAVRGVKTLTEPSGAAPGFTIYRVAPDPVFHPKTWRLTVDGLVTHRLSLSYHELLNLPSVVKVRDYQCVTGWKVPHVRWEGVSLQTLARIAGASVSAKFINFYCSDGIYSESLRIPEQAFKPDVMLGYSLNNRALAPVQGAPLRLVVPEMYGYKYAKWVNRVEFSDHQVLGYWEQNGYTVDAYLGTE